MQNNMIYTITITNEKGIEVTRKYNWEADGTYEEKGKIVEDMIEVIK